MIIFDKHGARHEVEMGKTITVDGHRVGAFTQNDSVATIQGFSLPATLQGMGVGSAILSQIELGLQRNHVHTIRVAIPFEDCPIHAAFWKKHGYQQEKNIFTKQF